MNITQADINDAEEILKLQKIAYQSEAKLYNDYTIPPLIQTLEEISEQFSNYTFLKAIQDGNIIGSVRAYVENSTCYIGRLIVQPDAQGRGIGTELMYEIERVFSECKRYELFTGDKSEKNIRFYERLGYQIFETERVSDKLTLVFMEKDKKS